MELFGAKLQYEAAMKYYKGVPKQGYSRNRSKAFKLFKEASEAGLVEAMVKLSKMYEKGEGCKIDHKEAFKWLERAASKGNMEAQYHMGCHYLSKRFGSIACEWLEKAANQGHVEAMYALGEYYVIHDLMHDEAIQWLSQPVLNNNPHAIYYLAKAYERKEEAELNPFPKFDELYECIDDEFDIYYENLEQNNDSLHTKLNDENIEIYQPSNKVLGLYKKALQLYEQEASFGDWKCAFLAADMYLHGEGCEVNYTKAFNYLYHLANQPKSDYKGKNNEFYRERALIKLAKMYELGLGCEQNIDKCNDILNQLYIDKDWFDNMSL